MSNPVLHPFTPGCVLMIGRRLSQEAKRLLDKLLQ
jgi:hypothetical protein